MRRTLLLCAWLMWWAAPAFGQTVLSTTLLQTPLPVGVTDTTAVLADTSAVAVGDTLFVGGEGLRVTAVNGATVTVRRSYGTAPRAHEIGAVVYVGASESFSTEDVAPGADCSSASVTPHINLRTGRVFHCLNTRWALVPEQAFAAVIDPHHTHSAATPSSLSNGLWWVECTGTSPARICAVKIRDGETTRTITSITF